MTVFIKIGEFIVKNGAEIAGGIAIAVGSYVAGRNEDKIKGAFKKKPKRRAKKRVAKRSNTKTASGNRKVAAKKVVKKKVIKKKPGNVGEKSTAVKA